MTVAIVVNAQSGARRGREEPDAVARRARAVLSRLGADVRCLPTRGPGHARDLARQAVEEGADVVCAWGGDGTVNEVASALASGGGVLAVVPAGSGNGFARELGIPFDRDEALETAVTGAIRQVDVGVANGRPFIVTAGIGFDAHVAAAFAADPRGVRGGWRYVTTGLREALRYRPADYRVVVDGLEREAGRMLLIVVANTRQWGNNARIAPKACPDDGVLDVVTVADRPIGLLALHLWRLWTGTIDRVRGVHVHRGRDIRITCEPAACLHVDGEPVGTAPCLSVSVTPGALSVRVPRR